MLVDFDKNPNLSEQQKLISLKNSINRAIMELNELLTTKANKTDIKNNSGGGGGITLKDVYPVGSILMSTREVSAGVGENPSTWISGTTWVAWGSGRVPVGVDSTDSAFNTVEKTGGRKDAVLPKHRHQPSTTERSFITSVNPLTKNKVKSGSDTIYEFYQDCNELNRNGYTDYQGVDLVGNENLQPYITCYMWKRTN